MLNCYRILIISILLLATGIVNSQSKQVFVYQLPQQYWDVVPGDTLGEIVSNLLPSAPEIQQSLMQSIVNLNPDAFIDNNPDRLRANIRLILPGNIQTHSIPTDSSSARIKQYSWGSIKKRDP